MPIKYNKFILFGDSITQFSHEQTSLLCSWENKFAFAPAIQNYYSRKLDVITRGYGGYNSNYAALILPEILKAEKTEGIEIKLMMIFFGTNDAANTNQHVPIERYKKNLDLMINCALSYSIKPIIIGPTLHDQERLKNLRIKHKEPTDIPFSSSEATKEYSNAAKEVAVRRGVAFIDLWNAFKEESGLTEDQIYAGSDLTRFLDDGIHLALYGNEILYRELIKAIKNHYPELDAVNLPTILPIWKGFNIEEFDDSISKAIS